MDVTDITPIEQDSQPTDSQLARAAAIRRFNFRFVFLPIGFISLVLLITTIGLLYLALFPPNEYTSQTISGMADAATIIGIIPLLLLCAIFPTLAIVATVQGKSRGIAPIRQLQLLLWRLDGGIYGVRQVIGRIAQRVANPFIAVQAAFAFVSTLLKRIVSLFKKG